MGGLMSPHTAPDGRRMMLESSVLDIDRRLKDGDPTLGWGGDPGMWLEFDQVRNVFIVCRHNPNTGATDDIMSWPPPLDERLIRKIVEADTQRRGGNDPVARMFAEEDARERAQEKALEEYLAEEAAPRFVHAMRKDGVDVAGRRTFIHQDPA